MSILKSGTLKGDTYEVFGRDHKEKPLQHLGSIVAENHKLAVAHARFTYSERPWVELNVAPTASFSDCLRAGVTGKVGMA